MSYKTYFEEGVMKKPSIGLLIFLLLISSGCRSVLDPSSKQLEDDTKTLSPIAEKEQKVNLLIENMLKGGYHVKSKSNQHLEFVKRTDSFELTIKYGSGVSMSPHIFVRFNIIDEEDSRFHMEVNVEIITSYQRRFEKHHDFNGSDEAHKIRNILQKLRIPAEG